MKKILIQMSVRGEVDTLLESPTPLSPDPVAEGGGGGCYASVHDYTRVLSDLLRDAPRLSRKETVDTLFTAQFPDNSPSLAGLQTSNVTYKPTLDDSLKGVTINYGLAGILVIEDVVRENYFRPKGTMSWSGVANMVWGINRERGVAWLWATQVLPFGDRGELELAVRFETAVWRSLVM